jgi:hypothetical protein
MSEYASPDGATRHVDAWSLFSSCFGVMGQTRDLARDSRHSQEHVMCVLSQCALDFTHIYYSDFHSFCRVFGMYATILCMVTWRHMVE